MPFKKRGRFLLCQVFTLLVVHVIGGCNTHVNGGSHLRGSLCGTNWTNTPTLLSPSFESSIAVHPLSLSLLPSPIQAPCGKGHTLIERATLSDSCRQFSPHVRAQAYRIQNKTKEALEDLDMAIQHGNGQPTILNQVKHQCSLPSFNHSSLQKINPHFLYQHALFCPPFLYLGLHSARSH